MMGVDDGWCLMLNDEMMLDDDDECWTMMVRMVMVVVEWIDEWPMMMLLITIVPNDVANGWLWLVMNGERGWWLMVMKTAVVDAGNDNEWWLVVTVKMVDDYDYVGWLMMM